MVKEAKDYGCGTIYITASDMGVKLYESYGFKHIKKVYYVIGCKNTSFVLA